MISTSRLLRRNHATARDPFSETKSSDMHLHLRLIKSQSWCGVCTSSNYEKTGSDIALGSCLTYKWSRPHSPLLTAMSCHSPLWGTQFPTLLWHPRSSSCKSRARITAAAGTCSHGSGRLCPVCLSK